MGTPAPQPKGGTTMGNLEQTFQNLENEDLKKNTKTLRKYFKKFLETGAYSTPPGKAACALKSAKILLEFQEREREELVRIQAEPEEESYFDVYGTDSEKEREEIEVALDLYGCWNVFSEYYDGNTWQMADSIGMCTGYNDPTDPFQNVYIVNLMAEAISQLKIFQSAETEITT
jgi:hypothetical protein